MVSVVNVLFFLVISTHSDLMKSSVISSQRLIPFLCPHPADHLFAGVFVSSSPSLKADSFFSVCFLWSEGWTQTFPIRRCRWECPLRAAALLLLPLDPHLSLMRFFPSSNSFPGLVGGGEKAVSKPFAAFSLILFMPSSKGWIANKELSLEGWPNFSLGWSKLNFLSSVDS